MRMVDRGTGKDVRGAFVRTTIPLRCFTLPAARRRDQTLGMTMTPHPIRDRFNAWLLAVLDGYMHAKYGALKSSLLGDAPPTVLEIGPGAGANFRYYPRGTHVVAVEPNVGMHARLMASAARHGIELELLQVDAESIPLEGASVDLVCSTLVLCSVDRPESVVAEARRLLRPRGRFVCIEHVAAPRSSPVEKVQRSIRRPWRWLFEGCDLCRDTETTLRSAGFHSVEVRRFKMRTAFVPLRYQIAAVCTV